jgi:excisionase family DNA binding protein
MPNKTDFPEAVQDVALAQIKKLALVRAEVIAKHFDVHKRTVALWAERGEIPCIRVGGVLRFDLEAVLGAAR